MTQPAVSVIVVSKGRGKSLALTLTGLIRQLYAPYEIIVVADAEGISTVKAMWLEDKVKAVPFADPNISLARNIGVSVAAGEVIAFLDDDAVPEPTWLTHLTAPFNDPQVSAVGGYVIGRNGISFQWTARAIDYAAREVALDVEGDRPVALTPPRGQAVKTEGTNMAFRRSDLAQVGGFDPAYHFYLDDADLNMRLAKAGRVTAIAPLAQVHHAFAPSPRRGADRVPRDLSEIGASLQVYLRRHCPEAERAAVIDQFRADQQARLIRHLITGGLEPRDVTRLRNRLDEGLAAGLGRVLYRLPELPHPSEPFLPFESRATQPGTVIAGRWFEARRLRDRAARRASRGEITSLFLFSPNTLFHTVKMTPQGVWEQRGGLWGRSLRSDPIFRPTTFRRRMLREIARVAKVRGIPREN